MSLILLFLTVLTIITTVKAQSQPEYLYHECSNTTTFAANSTYQTNLNNLLSTLSSYGNQTIGFYNSSTGKAPDDVSGLYLCRGDLTTDDCQQCVDFAAKDIIQRCPNQKVSIVWYDACLLRYSDLSIFSVLDLNPNVLLRNVQNVTGNVTLFNDLVDSSMREIAAVASSVAAGTKKFAARETNYTGSRKIYTLVQCTPDLSRGNCDQCLQTAIAQLPTGYIGARILTPSCNVRFETYPFFNTSAVSLPNPPPPPPISSSPIPPSSSPQSKGNNRTAVLVLAIVSPVSVSIVLFCFGFYFLRRRSRKKKNIVQNAENEITATESLQFDFDILQAATNNFASDTKLGEGGFGSVYKILPANTGVKMICANCKGTLPNGREVAVKRLSRHSGQGAEQFKNEVLLMAKLQHRNLVRLLGFCLKGEEKILVYEYVPNKSLDYFLFDLEKRRELDWSRRYKIIVGIARGILYLHQDSRVRIIHRDLKASNILLDEDMNPKISDFGMARIFDVDQTQGNTSRVVGTYGYMSPEYAMHGHFSVKSDAYNFGVLVLEIITGKRNNSFYETDGAYDLPSYVWKQWRDGTPLQVLDPTIGDTYSRDEVITCIHLGLLCVQEDPVDRPTMETVVLMLNSYSVTLPSPQQPAFFLHSRSNQSTVFKGLESEQSSTTKSIPLSVDEASITEVHPR